MSQMGGGTPLQSNVKLCTGRSHSQSSSSSRQQLALWCGSSLETEPPQRGWARLRLFRLFLFLTRCPAGLSAARRNTVSPVGFPVMWQSVSVSILGSLCFRPRSEAGFTRGNYSPALLITLFLWFYGFNERTQLNSFSHPVKWYIIFKCIVILHGFISKRNSCAAFC